jgi:3-deoxy-D-manno-octulosonic-acid transferase
VWVHALSLGELLSAIPLIRGMKEALGPRPVVVSVSTLAGRRVADELLGEVVDGICYFPFDIPQAYGRFLKQLDPGLLVLIETDIWPGYLHAMRRRKTPCLLLNARLSQRSFRSYKRWWSLFGPAFRTFERIYPQSGTEGDRFVALGVERERLGESGNLKFDATGGPLEPETVEALRSELHLAPGRRVLLAGSTHDGEEEMVRRIFVALRREHPELHLIVVPRHPKRSEKVFRFFEGDGLSVRLLSETREEMPDVLIVDRLGYLNRLYSVADVAFVGGSFVRKGGQNPIEPAMAGRSPVFGPDMTDFPDIASELVAGGGAFQPADEGAFLEVCHRLLNNPQLAKETGMRAQALVKPHLGITARLVGQIASRAENL